MLILKLFRTPEWDYLRDQGSTEGAPVDVADGFIHFSTPGQAPQTAARHFAGATGLWLIACDSDALGPALRWEPSRGGDLFPHLYRPLLISDVAWHQPLPLGPDGHVFPPLPG